MAAATARGGEAPPRAGPRTAASIGQGAAACTAATICAADGGRGDVSADIEADRRAATARAEAPPSLQAVGNAPSLGGASSQIGPGPNATTCCGQPGGGHLGEEGAAEEALADAGARGDAAPTRGESAQQPTLRAEKRGSGAGVMDRPRRADSIGHSRGAPVGHAAAGSGAELTVDGPTGGAPGGAKVAWLQDGCNVHTDDAETLAPTLLVPPPGRADSAGDCGTGGMRLCAEGSGERFAVGAAAVATACVRSRGGGDGWCRADCGCCSSCAACGQRNCGGGDWGFAWAAGDCVPRSTDQEP
mmetsp:Transcript_1586/g.4293  ORF Transcript_1586/g.4293 Transcript_1586/m.4293 type:complete len:302 (-) Transcript_1586:579-1484(-)